jgi:hypothetical protein
MNSTSMITIICRSHYPEELSYKLYERRAKSRLAMAKHKQASEVSIKGAVQQKLRSLLYNINSAKYIFEFYGRTFQTGD